MVGLRRAERVKKVMHTQQCRRHHLRWVQEQAGTGSQWPQPKVKNRRLVIATIGALFLFSLSAFAGAATLDELKATLDQPIQPRGSGSCPAPEQFSVTRPDPP